ncbi:MAG: aquaporin family protein [Planctomycetales bacterium]|nr:aquaporin family protein [Planctomycetales bacterium]
MSNIFLAEAVGTAILILLGNGVVANVALKATGGHRGGWICIAAGWGLAVALAVYSVGRISGAHINPAVTVSLLALGEIKASVAPDYLGGQFVGALAGAVLVWLAYKKHFDATDDPAAIRSCFCTSPAIASPVWNFVTEFLGTAMLVFGVLAVGANAGEISGEPLDLSAAFSTAVNPLLVGLLVMGIGLSLGGPTGYAINPARDLGPRIIHAVLPIPRKGDSDWGYAWTPIVGPLAGGVAGAFLWRSMGL